MDTKYLHTFWSKVTVSGPDDCWEWTGPRDWDGYGLFSHMLDSKKRSDRAHRLSWQLSSGTAPGKMFVCHKCDNPPCCNPDHLFLGTARDNFRDCLSKGRYSPKGSGNAAAKLNEQDARDIRANWALCRVSQRELAERFSVSQQTISLIVRGAKWKHV